MPHAGSYKGLPLCGKESLVWDRVPYAVGGVLQGFTPVQNHFFYLYIIIYI
jgi:hypothetical protein